MQPYVSPLAFLEKTGLSLQTDRPQSLGRKDEPTFILHLVDSSQLFVFHIFFAVLYLLYVLLTPIKQ